MANAIWGRLSLCAIALAASSGTIIADDDRNPRTNQEDNNGPSINSHDKTALAGSPTKGSTGQMTPAITKHNGPVMTATPKPYLIWYGNWNQTNGSDTPAGQQLVRDFLAGLSNSPYFQLNISYGASGGVGTPSETTVTAAHNSSLSDNGVLSVVTSVINAGTFSANKDGVYFVVTSSDIAKSGFCTSYCGWHTRATIKGVDIKYSFVGNANRCLSSCAAQTVSPNGNAGVDGMLSVLAHELEETVSDPDLNAWYDSKGAENADKCAWTFGQNQSQLASGAFYNMTMAGKNYLIQRNLSATDSRCYVSAGVQ